MLSLPIPLRMLLAAQPERVTPVLQVVQRVLRRRPSTAQAAGRDRDAAICPLVQAVVDTRHGGLMTHVLPVVREVAGSSVRAEKGRKPQRHYGPCGLRSHEDQEWLQAGFANLDACVGDRREGPLPCGRIKPKLRWCFVPQ